MILSRGGFFVYNMGTQTYDNYHREYYQKNKKKILARTRAYRKKYNKERYLRLKLEKTK